MTRKAWLRRRTRRNQLPPKRVRLMFSNAAGVSTREVKTREIVRDSIKRAEKLGVSAIGFCEVRDIDVLPELPENWAGIQYGETDSEKHGVALAWERSQAKVDMHEIHVGSEATSEGSWKTGSGIGQRSFIEALVQFGDGKTSWRAKLKPGHAPPPRAPRARADYIEDFVDTSGILMADWNLPKRIVVRLTGYKVVGEGVMWFAVPRRMNIKLVGAIHVGSDHKAIVAEVW